MRLDTFLACFFPKETEQIHLRGFSPKELPVPQREPVTGTVVTRAGLAGNADLQARLKNLNRTQGLYFVPNSGGFKEYEITRCNAVFCEIDNIPLQEQHDLYELAPLPPSLRVETKKSVHAYWLLPEAHAVNREEWYLAQCGLIDYFKSDAGIKNPNRVMRLPFFNHLTWDEETNSFEYKRVNIHTFNPELRFDIRELLEAYPYAPPPKAVATNGAAGPFDDTIEGIANELRRRISQHATYKVEPDGVHGVCQGVCHNAVFGKTAIMVNLQTGAVFCHAGCDYWTIAGAFGLSKPVNGAKNGHGPQQIVRPRGAGMTKTGNRLRTSFYKD